MRKTAVCGMVVLAIGSSQTRFDSVVREDFFAGYAGDAARMERGMKTCEEALAANPKDAPAMVWHGGGLLSQAGPLFQQGNYQRGKEKWYRGLKEINDAVALEPDSLQTVIPRGAIFLATSHYIDAERAKPLLETGVADYEKVLELEKPFFAKASVHSRGELMGGLADGYRLLGNNEKARENLERLVQELPGTAYEKQAKRWLADLGAVGKQERFCIGCHTGAR
jgi:tetratricopeptide (TPR) repeat protein